MQSVCSCFTSIVKSVGTTIRVKVTNLANGSDSITAKLLGVFHTVKGSRYATRKCLEEGNIDIYLSNIFMNII